MHIFRWDRHGWHAEPESVRMSGTVEFHVSRAARERYAFEERLFSLRGRAIFPDFAASRRFAQQINAKRDIEADPGSAVRAGDINAMGLIDEILHFVIELYREERNPQVMRAALQALEERLAADVLEATLRSFVEHFPTVAIMRGEVAIDEYLAGETEGIPNREAVLEELLLLWLANGNQAFAPVGELFDDGPLEVASGYGPAIRGLQDFFAAQPGFGPDDVDLITLLRRPAQEEPSSITAQLSWMRRNWGMVLARYDDRLAVSLDVLSEEQRATWMRFHATHGGADGEADTSALHGFDDLEGELERFSQDLDWMPRLVLIAKSTYVWLDQLARVYGRPIWRLDQIPDEELDRLAQAGFSGLWLIGLWERSGASQRIKQMRGSPDAVASAYSLMDYRISGDLGGEEAYGNLRDRAWARGIRLASDMVPNHMGLDSRWVIEHPDWFMARPDPPYPAYSYNGPNLSADERVAIHIEDHYFDNTDAAVTFKRVDRWNGEERFIYHGNDGTSMPWNDTAQLDYLKPEVREALIQTILHVARLFPVIRFDAAMTLAKRHIQRLWYPEPGSGGAIPSRAEYSMTKREFERAMPVEFWREVVDRVAAEAPGTLLLAEAFWLMEGYFVRTLGMHRVYNSAFMNMLRDEKNAEYRLVVKNTLEFDPQILKRYVNFMNNPDERSAVEQFGSGDKYFGVCTLMVTMPGLPMFGHGQLEGFTEKYGMEYRRARLQEEVDEGLIARHEREIFPLLHQRQLFAEVDHFTLYDFYTGEGTVNEDVYAYSNRRDGERTLVVYHNRYAETRGWIRVAALGSRTLAEGLALADDAQRFLALRDQRSGLQYLRNASELHAQGLYLELDAYRCHVFLELRDLIDTDGSYARLAAFLAGRGVPDLEAALYELDLQPFHDALRRALDPAFLRRLIDQRPTVERKLDDEFRGRLLNLLREAAVRAGAEGEEGAVETPALPPAGPLAGYLDSELGDEGAGRALYACWLICRELDRALPAATRKRWIKDWAAGPIIASVLPQLGVPADSAAHAPDIIAALLSYEERGLPAGDGLLSADALHDAELQRAIGVNEFEGVTWFDRERFERTISWLPLPGITGAAPSKARLESAQKEVRRLRRAAEDAGYRLDRLEQTVSRRPTGGSRAR
jgi:glycosidase